MRPAAPLVAVLVAVAGRPFLVAATPPRPALPPEEVSQVTGPVQARDFGAKGDYDPRTGKGTDDTEAIRKAINAARGHWVLLGPGTYKISGRLDTGDAPVRLEGAMPPGSDSAATTLYCVGTPIAGTDDPDVKTSGASRKLAGLRNLRLVGMAGAPYLAHFTPYQGLYENLAIEGFTRYGLWTRGGAVSRFSGLSFKSCGLGLQPSGLLRGRTYRAGAAWMIECSNPASDPRSGAAYPYGAGRDTSGDYRPTTFWVRDVEMTWAEPVTTSPRSILCFGLLNSHFDNIQTYNGHWFSFTIAQLDDLWTENFATGGEKPGDGKPLGLVESDSALQIGTMYLTSGHRRYRSTPFDRNWDFWGYDVREGPEHRKSRLQLFELILGDHRPDTESDGWVADPGKGTQSNPSLVYEPRTHSWNVSRGTGFVPALGFPLFASGKAAPQKDTVLDLASITPVPSATPLQGGSLGAEFEITIRVGEPDAYYYAVFRCIAGPKGRRHVRLGQIDALSGFVTVDEVLDRAGSGSLVIKNRGTSDLQWAASGRVLGPNSFRPAD